MSDQYNFSHLKPAHRVINVDSESDDDDFDPFDSHSDHDTPSTTIRPASLAKIDSEDTTLGLIRLPANLPANTLQHEEILDQSDQDYRTGTIAELVASNKDIPELLKLKTTDELQAHLGQIFHGFCSMRDLCNKKRSSSAFDGLDTKWQEILKQNKSYYTGIVDLFMTYIYVAHVLGIELFTIPKGSKELPVLIRKIFASFDSTRDTFVKNRNLGTGLLQVQSLNSAGKEKFGFAFERNYKTVVLEVFNKLFGASLSEDPLEYRRKEIQVNFGTDLLVFCLLQKKLPSFEIHFAKYTRNGNARTPPSSKHKKLKKELTHTPPANICLQGKMSPNEYEHPHRKTLEVLVQSTLQSLEALVHILEEDADLYCSLKQNLNQAILDCFSQDKTSDAKIGNVQKVLDDMEDQMATFRPIPGDTTFRVFKETVINCVTSCCDQATATFKAL
ncbi:hypothetical protein MPSEU_000332300 [Mayamaea pseudoterrestris]|nr:hypothetical protein MPSEU_000332300 [Mayamaea pseudoterrestris]